MAPRDSPGATGLSANAGQVVEIRTKGESDGVRCLASYEKRSCVHTPTLNVAKATLLESYVSHLGYGIQPPAPSSGNILNHAQIYLTSAPWLAIAPVRPSRFG